MGSLSIWHWLVVLLVVMMVFGTKKLKNIGNDLGEAVKGFKEGMKEGSTPSPPSMPPTPQVMSGTSADDKVTVQATPKV